MVSHLFFYQLALIVLVWLFLGLCRKFCSGGREGADTPVCGRD